MLTLMAPMALAGMVLLSIPILVHLFKPRRVRVTLFSSLRWLRLTQHKLSRKIQLHQLLLFLLRAAFVALIVLALARPVYKPPGVRSSSERFVVLDISRSMGAQPETRPGPFELAKQVAARLTTGGLGDDRTTILLAASTARALGPLTRAPEHYLGPLREAQVTDADTRLTSALPLINSMLTQRRQQADAEVFFITDNHRKIWAANDILEFQKDMTNSVRVRMIDVGSGGVANAWIAGARLQQHNDRGRRILLVQLGASGASSQSRTLRLTGLQGAIDLTRTVTIEPNVSQLVQLELPSVREARDGIVRMTLEPEDALASDDEYHVDLTQRLGLRILIIEGKVTEVEQLRPAFHLDTALQAISASREHAFEIIRRNASETRMEDIREASIIFMVDVPELRVDLVPLLKEKIMAGTGLGLFLGPEISMEFYNTNMFDPLKPEDSLLPFQVNGPFFDKEQVARLVALSQFRWNHKVLAGLHDPVLGDLGEVKVSSFQDIKLVEGASADILATYVLSGAMTSERSVIPAIVDRPYGAGRILVFNMTANDRWGDLPRRKSFVPLVDRVLEYLADSGERLVFEVGEPVTLSLLPIDPSDVVEVVGPGEIRMRPEQRDAGTRTLLRVGLLWRAGVYQVLRNGEPEFSFVLHPGQADSDLRPTEPDVLNRLWAESDFETISHDAAIKGNAKEKRRNLAHWVVALCALLLLIEMYLVHRLCPRMNPRTVRPVSRWRIGKGVDEENGDHGSSSRVHEEVAAG